jgi:hypothetical protein
MMEERKNLIIRQFDNSTMERWNNGKVEEWEEWKIGDSIVMGVAPCTWHLALYATLFAFCSLLFALCLILYI